MTIQADEAANALRDAEVAAGRAVSARGYQSSSGHLLVWGAIWTLANVACQVSMQAGEIVWGAGALIGVTGSVILGSRQAARRPRQGRAKALIIATAIASFAVCDALVAPRLSFQQSDAIAALLVGAVYVAMGASAGLRLSAVGGAIMLTTMAGWYLAHDYFFLWMAATGGGGLILGGLWFRKV